MKKYPIYFVFLGVGAVKRYINYQMYLHTCSDLEYVSSFRKETWHNSHTTELHDLLTIVSKNFPFLHIKANIHIKGKASSFTKKFHILFFSLITCYSSLIKLMKICRDFKERTFIYFKGYWIYFISLCDYVFLMRVC